MIAPYSFKNFVLIQTESRNVYPPHKTVASKINTAEEELSIKTYYKNLRMYPNLKSKSKFGKKQQPARVIIVMAAAQKHSTSRGSFPGSSHSLPCETQSSHLVTSRQVETT